MEQTFVTEGWWVMNCVLGGRCMKTSLKKQATPVQLFVCITKDTVCPWFTTPFDPYKFIKKLRSCSLNTVRKTALFTLAGGTPYFLKLIFPSLWLTGIGPGLQIMLLVRSTFRIFFSSVRCD